MLKKSVVEHTLEAALETGADFAELYVEQTKRNHIAMVNGQVETALGGLDYGAGIRLFCGNRVIYAFVNDTSEENLVRTAREMASTVKGTHLLRLPDWKTRQWQNINPIFVLPDDVEKRKKADYLAAASAAAFAYDPAITQTRRRLGRRKTGAEPFYRRSGGVLRYGKTERTSGPRWFGWL